MKFKKIMAGVLAASLAVTSLSVGAWATDAAAPATKDVTLYENSTTADVPIRIPFTTAARTALQSATSSLVVTVTGTGEGSQGFYIQEMNGWKNVTGSTGSGPYTITVDTSTKIDETNAVLDVLKATLAANKDIFVCPQNFTSVTTVEVTTDSNAAIKIYDSAEAPAGMSYSTAGDIFEISGTKLTESGVTEANVKDCSLKVTLTTAGSNKEVSLLTADDDWSNVPAHIGADGISANSTLTVPFDGKGYGTAKTAAELVAGLHLNLKDMVVTKIVLVVPASDEEEGGEDPVTPPADDNKKNYTLVGTETVCGTYEKGQLWKELPFDVAEGDVIAITYKDKVIDQATGKWPTILLNSTAKNDDGLNIQIAAIQAADLTADSGTYKYTITAQDVTNLKGGKLCLCIVNMTVSKIVINPEEGGTTPPAGGNKETVIIVGTETVCGNYGDNQLWKELDFDVEAGDVIAFTYKDKVTDQATGKWPTILLNSTTKKDDGLNIQIATIDAGMLTADSATYEYTITAQDVKNLKGGKLCLLIVNMTVSKIVLNPEPEEKPAEGSDNKDDDILDLIGEGNDFQGVVAPESTDAPSTEAPAEVVTAANGESVEAPANVIPDGATLEVTEQTKEDAVKAVEAVKATDENKEVVETVKKAVEDDKAAVVEIDLVKDGVKVQPNGTIKVVINVPTALKDAAKLFVYRVEEDGKFTDVKATVENGKIVFTTSHFSTYIVTSEALSGDAVVTEATEATPAETTAPAAPANPEDKNQNTGVVLAIVPAIIAAAGVMVAKKRK